MSFQTIKKGVVKRTVKRCVGVFVDGIGLDRAARRLERKVDMTALIRGVTSGLPAVVARYYTLIPFEDDSRHRSFLDAVSRAGLSVIVKRLPPKGITRQATIDVEMAADITAFAMGYKDFSSLSEYTPDSYDNPNYRGNDSAQRGDSHTKNGSSQNSSENEGAPGSDDSKKEEPEHIQRIITVVCPSRDLAYPISLAKDLGVDTVTADFGQFNSGDILKSSAKWIDLSDSETIWRD